MTNQIIDLPNLASFNIKFFSKTDNLSFYRGWNFTLYEVPVALDYEINWKVQYSYNDQKISYSQTLDFQKDLYLEDSEYLQNNDCLSLRIDQDNYGKYQLSQCSEVKQTICQKKDSYSCPPPYFCLPMNHMALLEENLTEKATLFMQMKNQYLIPADPNCNKKADYQIVYNTDSVPLSESSCSPRVEIYFIGMEFEQLVFENYQLTANRGLSSSTNKIQRSICSVNRIDYVTIQSSCNDDGWRGNIAIKISESLYTCTYNKYDNYWVNDSGEKLILDCAQYGNQIQWDPLDRIEEDQINSTITNPDSGCKNPYNYKTSSDYQLIFNTDEHYISSSSCTPIVEINFEDQEIESVIFENLQLQGGRQ